MGLPRARVCCACPCGCTERRRASAAVVDNSVYSPPPTEANAKHRQKAKQKTKKNKKERTKAGKETEQVNAAITESPKRKAARKMMVLLASSRDS